MSARSAILFCAASALLFFAAPRAQAQQPDKPLTLQAIFAPDGPSGAQPKDMAWAPDGKRLTYLYKDELLEADPQTGAVRTLIGRERLTSLAGGKDSETDRDHRERYKMGATSGRRTPSACSSTLTDGSGSSTSRANRPSGLAPPARPRATTPSSPPTAGFSPLSATVF